MVVLDDKFQLIKYDSQSQLMIFFIKADSQVLSEQDYLEKVVIPGAKVIIKYKPKKIFLDVTHFKYVMTIEGEKKLQEIILEAYQIAGVERLAILIPQDVFAQITVAQVTNVNANFIIKYFVNRNKALNWLEK